jgi:hypothetical protein
MKYVILTLVLFASACTSINQRDTASENNRLQPLPGDHRE